MYLLRTGGSGHRYGRAQRRPVLGLVVGVMLLSLGGLVQAGFAWRLLAAPAVQSGDGSEPAGPPNEAEAAAVESEAEDAPEPPRLLISEVMVAPLAVADKKGEWVEVANAGDQSVNLRTWVLADKEERHRINADVWVDPGAYVVLARNPNPDANGGVHPDYVYSDIDLNNDEGTLLLLTADEITVTHVVWGGDSGLATTAGASLERVHLEAGEEWVTAQSVWPGSAGDRGSPGAPYTAPTPTPTATLSPTATATEAPTNTPVPTDTPTPPPSTAPKLHISEIMANPSAVTDAVGEWV